MKFKDDDLIIAKKNVRFPSYHKGRPGRLSIHGRKIIISYIDGESPCEGHGPINILKDFVYYDTQLEFNF